MTLWSRLKIHFRIKPWGAAWACTACSWVAMLLLLRLPLGQPFVKLFLTDNLHDSVHLVVPQAAKLRAGKLEFAGLNGGEMHVNRETGHGVLFEAHRGDEEAVNHVMRAENHFDLTIHRHDHNAGDDVVFGSRVVRIETESTRAAEGCVVQFRARGAKFSVGPRVPEIPGKLHAGDFHLYGAGLCRIDAFGRPDRVAGQVQSDK